ncbi:terminase TerL endonuclease subunit [Faecalibacterium sp. 7]|uniref:terminase TerL endonuclease subunit n=1 Tax=Faecalibacterium sp. 7 TaxID=3402017 RepID=UPI003C2C2824
MTNDSLESIFVHLRFLGCTLSKLPQSMRQKYDEFMREGTLAVMEGTVLDMMEVYDDLDAFIEQSRYDVRCFGYNPYNNAKDFVERWARENGEYGIEKVIQGAKTESVPLGELKKLSEQRKLLFDEALMQFAMGNCITLEDTNGNRKLLKQRYDQKIDAVAAMMDAYVSYKVNRDAFERLLDYSFGAENLLDSSCWSFAERISIAISVS